MDKLEFRKLVCTSFTQDPLFILVILQAFLQYPSGLMVLVDVKERVLHLIVNMSSGNEIIIFPFIPLPCLLQGLVFQLLRLGAANNVGHI